MIVEKLTAKAIAYIVGAVVALALLGTAGYLVKRWDSNRLQARYDAGVAAERQVWTDAQAKATSEQRAAQDASTRASEGAADTAAQAATSARQAAAGDTETTVREITHAYQHHPPIAPCVAPGDGGSPRPLPVGVLDALDQARGRAIGKAPAPAG